MDFKINEVYYKVIELPDGDIVKLDATGDSILGLCDSISAKIYLHEKLSDQKKTYTLIHELTHAFIAEYIPGDDSLFSEEQVCDIVAIYGEQIWDMAQSYMDIKHHYKL